MVHFRNSLTKLKPYANFLSPPNRQFFQKTPTASQLRPANLKYALAPITPLLKQAGNVARLKSLKIPVCLDLAEHLLPIAKNPSHPFQKIASRLLRPFVQSFCIHGGFPEALEHARLGDVLDLAGSETDYSVEGAHFALDLNEAILAHPQSQKLKTAVVMKGTVLFGEDFLLEHDFIKLPMPDTPYPPEQVKIYKRLLAQVKTALSQGHNYMCDAESFNNEGVLINNDHLDAQTIAHEQQRQKNYHLHAPLEISLASTGNRGIVCSLIKDLAKSGIKDLSHLKITIQAGRVDAIPAFKAFKQYALQHGVTDLGFKFVINAYGSSRETFPSAYYQTREDCQQSLRDLTNLAKITTSPRMSIFVGTMNAETQQLLEKTPLAKGNDITFGNLYGMVTNEDNKVYIPFDPDEKNLYAYFHRRLLENREAAGSQGALKLQESMLRTERRKFLEQYRLNF